MFALAPAMVKQPAKTLKVWGGGIKQRLQRERSAPASASSGGDSPTAISRLLVRNFVDNEMSATAIQSLA